jgi:hypothetical protein
MGGAVLRVTGMGSMLTGFPGYAIKSFLDKNVFLSYLLLLIRS